MKKSLNLFGLALVALIAIAAVSTTDVWSKVTGYLYGHALYIESVPGTNVASINTAGALTVTGITNSGNLAVTGSVTSASLTTTGVITSGGQLVPQSVSSTTIATLVPASVGALVYNSTRYAICVGTATTAGSWIFQSSNPITTAGISCKE